VVIAQDAQGAEVAKPWVEKARATYRALLDQYNVIGKAYSLKFVPVGIMVDEEGRLARVVGGVNIDDEAFRQELIEWATIGTIPRAWIEADRRATPRALTPDEAEAHARFQLAVVFLGQGKREEAVAEMKRAFRLDPENWLIRKQLWAVEHPEAFYSGPVDYDWQKRQRQQEDAEIRQK
jgi:tetratricopeptide (TPR) repeat protein